MAFSSAITGVSRWGNKIITFGTFTTSSTETGGDIDTGLNICEFIKLDYSGSGAGATVPSVNETLPYNGHAITVVHAASADGYWWAIGY